ncbi:hypothetical protein Clacol_006075 [Clathrus columnatus]|uniref:DUF1014-domain-containing protein n=1 Tax=Clathrus columnatus TaxID=1419009 RepID=A0AAV5AB20_9AGAM|nr:hypothetical protein Clacol_006075 [Clathrus columnatus]
MAPKTVNTKKEAGKAKKAENEAKKKDAVVAEKERKEAASWEDGAKSNKSKESKEEKKRAEAARKAENARLLAEEEAALPVKAKPAPKAGQKKVVKPAGPGAIAAGGSLDLGNVEKQPVSPPSEDKIESFQATGIDDALDLLSIVNAKTDKASVGQQAAGIERHPEAAFDAYQERELPILRKDELLYKQFQKSPENPFNQATVAYDATKDEKLEALQQKKQKVEGRLREAGDDD